LAAKATLAMLREPALRGADVRLGAVQEGSVVIEVGPGADAAGEAARRAVERLPEVTDVRLEAKGAHPSPQETEEDQPTTSGPTGGPAGAPAGGTSGAEAVTGEAVAGDTRP